jgi:hypothetical protein
MINSPDHLLLLPFMNQEAANYQQRTGASLFAALLTPDTNDRDPSSHFPPCLFRRFLVFRMAIPDRTGGSTRP